MKSLKRALVVASVCVLTLSACEKEGPAEKAGKSVDETLEKVGESLKKAEESIAETINPKGPAEKAGEAIDKTAQSIKEKVEEVTK